MFGKKPPEVLVVGGGPVGLFTALLLHERGVRVQVIDKEWRTGTHSYALALHADSLRLLEEAGVAHEVLESARRIRTLGIYEGGHRKAELHLSHAGGDFAFVGVMRQADLESLLERALAARGIKVDWNLQLGTLTDHGDRVTAGLERLSKDTVGYAVQHTEWVVGKSKNHDYAFVVGADGHRSTVRRALGIEFPEVGPATDFAVFEFKTAADLGDEMRLVVADDTINVCWPLPSGYCRWSFELPQHHAATDERDKERTFGQIGGARFPVLAEDHLRKLLTERAPGFERGVQEIRWRMLVRFEQRLAEHFGRGRAWLAGDAGHLTGPAGVQSMNVGLHEARDLAERVAQALHGKAGLDSFQTYDDARRAEWRRLLQLDGAVEARAGADPWIAAHAKRLLSSLPASGAALTRLGEQLGLLV